MGFRLEQGTGQRHILTFLRTAAQWRNRCSTVVGVGYATEKNSTVPCYNRKPIGRVYRAIRASK